MRIRTVAALVVAALTQTCLAQWKDAHKIAQGGESTVASDGKGTVYVTAHGPAALYKSSDWGATFSLLKSFDDAQCDLCVLPLPNGTMHTMYLRNGVIGIGNWYSTDNGKTLIRGQNIDGDLDREWIALNPTTGKIFMDYSNGYIGGPKSKGVYCVSSEDNGKSFTPPVRVDREPDGSYGVDPYIARLSNGRVICMWQVSTDYNTIDAYRTAYSDDDGKTFSEPVTVADFPKKVGDKDVDTQERWILGSILALGKNDVIVDYPGYENVEVDGKTMTCFLQHFKVSHDGWATFGASQTVLAGEELKDAVRSFMKNNGENLDYGYYIENLPWLSADATGSVHMVFTDNRDGASSTMIKGKPLANWRVRHVTMKYVDRGFDRSEAVSGNYAAKRPPMDFISCSADSKYVYASWTMTPGSDQDWGFTGDLWVGRKPLK
jgi:hypothetical protein